VRTGFDKWWLVPSAVLTASALVALGILIFEPSFVDRSSDEILDRRAANEPAVECSGTLSSDYACHQERYQNLVNDSSVEAAFAKLKDDYGKNDFVRSGCHQLTHVIGRAAAELYSDVSGAFEHGEHFCGMGYYHGVMETLVGKIGTDKILEEADAICADMRQNRPYSEYHYGCAHGLGHGFMGIFDNELFESLYACDRLTDGWEKEHCYGGVFMQNVMAEDDPSHPSKYLKADQPLSPCTEVERRYKNMCYGAQTLYVLRTQEYDFAKAFDLCGEVEDGFRARCYQYLGYLGARQSIAERITDIGRSGAANMLCMLGEDNEIRAECVKGAVRAFIYHYHGELRQAKAFCESFNEADLRGGCLQEAEEPYEEFFDPN
jgi:hypothetical protein